MKIIFISQLIINFCPGLNIKILTIAKETSQTCYRPDPQLTTYYTKNDYFIQEEKGLARISNEFLFLEIPEKIR